MKVIIVSIFDKHEDFIELQFNSIIKHVKGDYEYVVYNNAKTPEQTAANKECCDRLGVKCVRIISGTGGPSDIAALGLANAFGNHVDEPVFKIDSDMFFISDVNLCSILSDNDLFYIPVITNTIMWSGVFGINRQRVKDALDFSPLQGDTFCKSDVLVANPDYTRKTFELLNLQKVDEDGTVTTNYNGDSLVIFGDDDEITFTTEAHYGEDGFYDGLVDRYRAMITLLDSYDFPTPHNVDFIAMDGVDFLVHFKSSNWCPWYTEDYVTDKKIAMTKMLGDL